MAQKKVQAVGTVNRLCQLIRSEGPAPSLRKQCLLLGIARGSYYYRPRLESAENLVLMRRLDELHLKHPVYGSRRLAAQLRRHGWRINRKRVQRLMERMGLEAQYPKPCTSPPGEGHEIYPYLLKGKVITGPNQVWCADITYIPMKLGFMYLVAIMDWWSRFVLAWRISNTLDVRFCLEAWRAALEVGTRWPLIANTDQGSQFTATEYLEAVEAVGTRVSMDGRRRWVDNVFIERVWRSFKYEDVYLRDYVDGLELQAGANTWFSHYNQDRPHQALGYATPAEVYFSPESYGAKPAAWVTRVGLQERVD